MHIVKPWLVRSKDILKNTAIGSLKSSHYFQAWVRWGRCPLELRPRPCRSGFILVLLDGKVAELQVEFAEICPQILSHPQGVQNSLQSHEGDEGRLSQGGITLVAFPLPPGVLWKVVHWMVAHRWLSAAVTWERDKGSCWFWRSHTCITRVWSWRRHERSWVLGKPWCRCLGWRSSPVGGWWEAPT